MAFIFNKSFFNALKDGNRESFNKLFVAYYPPLMGYTRLLVEEDIARDIVQDVFLYIWEQRSRFEYGEKFHSYLFQLCYTRALDVLRRNSRIQEKLILQAEELLNTELNWMKQNNQDIIRSLMSKDLMQQIEKLLDQLPEKRKEVFKLSFYHDMSNDEISDVLSIPKRTVESHLYLTLKFLRSQLSIEEFCSFMLFYIMFI